MFFVWFMGGTFFFNMQNALEITSELIRSPRRYLPGRPAASEAKTTTWPADARCRCSAGDKFCCWKWRDFMDSMDFHRLWKWDFHGHLINGFFIGFSMAFHGHLIIYRFSGVFDGIPTVNVGFEWDTMAKTWGLKQRKVEDSSISPVNFHLFMDVAVQE